MGSSIFSVGLSGLNAAQAGMTTTAHNIANASTPGYSRQTVVQGSRAGQNFGYGFVGKGVEVATIKRNYNEFLTAQTQRTQSTYSELKAYSTEVGIVDGLFADTTNGLSSGFQDMFGSVQQLTANPASTAARQGVLSSAETLVSRLRQMNSYLNLQQQGVNDQIEESVSNINSLTTQIAAVSEKIRSATLGGQGMLPNDLLDQRSSLVSQLSEQLNVSVVEDSAGTFSVYAANGQPLVLNERVYKMTTVASPTDVSRRQVAYDTGTTVTPLPDNYLDGGRLGGLLAFRTETLDRVQNELGRVAITMAQTFNDQHKLGIDINGERGGDFFTVAAPVSKANTNNTSAADVTAAFDDVTQLTGSDYQVDYDGSNYLVKRLSDGLVSTYASLPQSQDGVVFDVSGGPPAAGDSFLIRPTVRGVDDLSVLVKHVSRIAAAAPVTVTQASGNTGTGKIVAGNVAEDYFMAPFSSPVDFTYDSGTTSFAVSDPSVPVTVTVGGVATSYPPGSAIPFTAGATYNAGGAEFTLSGAPATGDSFSLAPNSNGVGDGRNALLLAGLQTAKTVGGIDSVQGALTKVVSFVGNKARELKVTSAAAENLHKEAIRVEQEVSGVNLDEEATNLIRYQQAYQAAGRVMQIAGDMFDTLLALGR